MQELGVAMKMGILRLWRNRPDELGRAFANWALARDPEGYRARAGDVGLTEFEEKAVSFHEDLSPWLRASGRSSWQGALLWTILSDVPRSTIRTALGLYRGLHRGYRQLRMLADREAARIVETCPLDAPDAPYYWAASSDTFLFHLLEVIGDMDTDASHETLIHFALPESHPVVRRAALYAMHAEEAKHDPEFILNVLANPGVTENEAYEALYAMSFHANRYPDKAYCKAIWPFVLHQQKRVYQEACLSIRSKDKGAELLYRYYLKLKADPNADPERLEVVEYALPYELD